MTVPSDLRYTESHEWVRVDGDEGTIGITHFAQDELGDLVFLELPAEGETFARAEEFGAIESVKAASELYMPIGGTVTEVHEDVIDAPETVNSDPYGEGWLIKITIGDKAELEQLMDPAQYEEFLAEHE